jgi:hypothetical protein
MLDFGTILWVLAGFGVLFAAAALAGSGTEPFLTGLFPHDEARDWPHGVQETDVPRFAVEHLDALGPLAPGNRLPGVTAMPHPHAN